MALPGDPLYDTAALRAIEASALAGQADPAILMQRAGRAGWQMARRCWPDARRIAVVCGPGNNGGDGYVLALQALQAGLDVRVVRLESQAPRTEAAQAMCAAFETAGGGIVHFDGALPAADLVIDALFGIGLSRAPDDATTALIEAINAHGAPVLALDTPSGLSADRGSVAGAAVVAARTLQFLAPQLGLRTGDGADHAGALSLDTLGIARTCATDARPAARRVDARDLAHWLRPRRRNAHKGRHGRVLCIGGDHGTGGAVLLAAGAALRAGAGLVEVATQGAHVAPLLARWPEAMVRRTDNVSALAGAFEAADVVALGPGLGQGAWGHTLFDETLDAATANDLPLVLDADALNLLAARPRTLPAGVVLTPHPGEAARLLGVDTADIQRDRPAAVRTLAARWNAVVVLKGAGSLVCAPGGLPWLIDAGNPGMATGGMGDVLTGIIAAMRAQGHGAEDAAVCGALLHAVAGDRAAAQGGERGLLPGDLIDILRACANPGAHA